jgi:hypothetical protein
MENKVILENGYVFMYNNQKWEIHLNSDAGITSILSFDVKNNVHTCNVDYVDATGIHVYTSINNFLYRGVFKWNSITDINQNKN